MSNELRLYDVTVGGHQTLMRLNDRDAEAYGADAVLAIEQILAGPVLTPSLAEPDPVTPPAEVVTEPKARASTHNKMRGNSDEIRSPMTVGRSHIITETE